MNARDLLSSWYGFIQRSLFPGIEEEIGPISASLQKVVETLNVVHLEGLLSASFTRTVGRPPKDRLPIARAFVAKAVLNINTTRALLDRLQTDPALRRICGFEKKSDIPSESVFSRAFDEFAKSELPQCVHEALIKETHQNRIVGHISRDSTAIEARERPVKKETKDTPTAKRRRGRPKKGEESPPKEPKRVEKQLSMALPEMLEELPKACDVGTKRNSKGHQTSWIGYKFHLDVADGQIPLCGIVTSASVHDSQVAIPLAEMSAQRTASLYDLMDAAYDCEAIKEHSRNLGHIPLIDENPRRDKARKEEILEENRRQKRIGLFVAEKHRYNERTAVERVNARLKDEFGARHVRVRGHAKVACHLFFGVLALTADQLLRFVQ